MITLANVSHASQTNPVNFLTSHKPGKIKSIGVSNGMNTHFFEIKIDGNKITRPHKGVQDIRFHSSQSYGGGEGNNGLSINSEFGSLEIDIWDGKAPASEPRYWCVFEIDGSHLSMTQDEFMDKWVDDEEDDLLTVDDDGDFVYLKFSDDDGEKILTACRGRTRHANIELKEEILHDGGDTVSGRICCTDWKGEPLNVDVNSLLPLELRLNGHSSVLEPITPDTVTDTDTGRFEWEISLPEYVSRNSKSWTLSTSGKDWANYQARFTVL